MTFYIAVYHADGEGVRVYGPWLTEAESDDFIERCEEKDRLQNYGGLTREQYWYSSDRRGHWETEILKPSEWLMGKMT